MTRICPSCGSKLGTNEKFFCSTCGVVLPAEVINKKPLGPKNVEAVVTLSGVVSEKAAASRLVKANIGKIVQPKYVYLALGIIIFMGFLFFSYKFLFPMITVKLPAKNISQAGIASNNKLPGQTTAPSSGQNQPSGTAPEAVVMNNKYILESSSPIITGNFSDTELIKYSPFETVLYIEASDGAGLLKGVMESKILDEESVAAYISENEKYFIGPAVFFVVQNENKFIQVIAAKVDEKSFSPSKSLEKLSLYNNGYLVLFGNEGLISDIKNSYEGLSKGFSLNSSYASAKSMLPAKGRMEIITTGRTGKAYLFQNIKLDQQDSFTSALGLFLDSGLDYAVIL